MTQFSKKEAVRVGWETFKKYPWVLISITLTVAVIPQLIQYLFQLPFQGSADNSSPESFTSLMWLGTIASIAVSLYLSVGVLKVYLQLVNNREIAYKDLFNVNAEEVVRYFLGSIVYGLIVYFTGNPRYLLGY